MDIYPEILLNGECQGQATRGEDYSGSTTPQEPEETRHCQKRAPTYDEQHSNDPSMWDTAYNFTNSIAAAFSPQHPAYSSSHGPPVNGAEKDSHRSLQDQFRVMQQQFYQYFENTTSLMMQMQRKQDAAFQQLRDDIHQLSDKRQLDADELRGVVQEATEIGRWGQQIYSLQLEVKIHKHAYDSVHCQLIEAQNELMNKEAEIRQLQTTAQSLEAKLNEDKTQKVSKEWFDMAQQQLIESQADFTAKLQEQRDVNRKLQDRIKALQEEHNKQHQQVTRALKAQKKLLQVRDAEILKLKEHSQNGDSTQGVHLHVHIQDDENESLNFENSQLRRELLNLRTELETVTNQLHDAATDFSPRCLETRIKELECLLQQSTQSTAVTQRPLLLQLNVAKTDESELLAAQVQNSDLKNQLRHLQQELQTVVLHREELQMLLEQTASELSSLKQGPATVTRDNSCEDAACQIVQTREGLLFSAAECLRNELQDVASCDQSSGKLFKLQQCLSRFCAPQLELLARIRDLQPDVEPAENVVSGINQLPLFLLATQEEYSNFGQSWSEALQDLAGCNDSVAVVASAWSLKHSNPIEFEREIRNLTTTETQTDFVAEADSGGRQDVGSISDLDIDLSTMVETGSLEQLKETLLLQSSKQTALRQELNECRNKLDAFLDVSHCAAENKLKALENASETDLQKDSREASWDYTQTLNNYHTLVSMVKTARVVHGKKGNSTLQNVRVMQAQLNVLLEKAAMATKHVSSLDERHFAPTAAVPACRSIAAIQAEHATMITAPSGASSMYTNQDQTASLDYVDVGSMYYDTTSSAHYSQNLDGLDSRPHSQVGGAPDLLYTGGAWWDAPAVSYNDLPPLDDIFATSGSLGSGALTESGLQ